MKAKAIHDTEEMERTHIHEKANIVGSLFLLTNRLQTAMDKEYAIRGTTTKQWFLMAVLAKLFPTPPKLSEVAVYMGSSYQNVKQLALKLEKNGILTLDRDPKDKRVLRLTLTPYFFEFWEGQESKEFELLETLFEKFDPKEIADFMTYIERVSSALDKV